MLFLFLNSISADFPVKDTSDLSSFVASPRNVGEKFITLEISRSLEGFLDISS